jgi:hypothetical protein
MHRWNDDWENVDNRMLALRCKGKGVIWHRKVTWRKKGGCSGRHSGDNQDTGGSDMRRHVPQSEWGR